VGGYDAREKRQELFDPESRFVVLGSPPVAYALFRFDTEETANERDAQVVYWCALSIRTCFNMRDKSLTIADGFAATRYRSKRQPRGQAQVER